MLYRTDFLFQGVTCKADVVFRYGADEETVYLTHIFVEYA